MPYFKTYIDENFYTKQNKDFGWNNPCITHLVL